MFWGDRIVEDIVKTLDTKKPLVIRDEKTTSGHIHVGAMRGVALHGALSQILEEQNIENTFLYELNDFDAFDSVPPYLDVSYEEHLGKPLYAIPSPEKTSKNYARYFGTAFAQVIESAGFAPQFYYSSEEYKAGKYNEVIRTALEKAEAIRRIYLGVSGGERPDDWLPIIVVCEKCGKVATTRATSFDGAQVHYICDQEGSGAVGCGHEGETSPFDGNAKLLWKVEWGAKFKVYEVDIEGEGKDLSTRGGARDVANHICREVFNHIPPYDVPYEFLLVEGKKMSTSKGNAAMAEEIASLLPSKILRTMLFGKDIKRAINFDPAGDTIPTLFDQYDTYAENYWRGEKDDETRVFEVIHEGKTPKEQFLPRFSQVAFLVQMPHMHLEEEVEKIKGSALSQEEKKELEERAFYAKRWLDSYAPEEYKYELQETLPKVASGFSEELKTTLKEVLAYVETQKALDGQELHTKLHEIRKASDVDPKEFFSALYLAFLGKENGPKAGWFLSVLDREFLIKRLEAMTN